MCRQDSHPGFETHGEAHIKSKIGAISDPSKWTLVQQKIFQKKIESLSAKLALQIQKEQPFCVIPILNKIWFITFYIRVTNQVQVILEKLEKVIVHKFSNFMNLYGLNTKCKNFYNDLDDWNYYNYP